MLTLTEFLLARIAEDEAAWSQATEFRLRADLTQVDMTMTERVLAECEAKRRIVDGHRETWQRTDPPTYMDGVWASEDRTLRILALTYDDHPDYREEWKP